MFIQQPSSARSQDVSHLLTKIFRQLYTHDSVPSDTVEYLNTSRGSNDTYHEEYVKALQKVSQGDNINNFTCPRGGFWVHNDLNFVLTLLQTYLAKIKSL